MKAVSDISTTKVDCPADKSSTAPTRVKILSAIFKEAFLAGNQLPI